MHAQVKFHPEHVASGLPSVLRNVARLATHVAPVVHAVHRAQRVCGRCVWPEARGNVVWCAAASVKDALSSTRCTMNTEPLRRRAFISLHLPLPMMQFKISCCTATIHVLYARGLHAQVKFILRMHICSIRSARHEAVCRSSRGAPIVCVLNVFLHAAVCGHGYGRTSAVWRASLRLVYQVAHVIGHDYVFADVAQCMQGRRQAHAR